MDIKQWKNLAEMAIFGIAIATTGVHTSDLFSRVKVLAYIVVATWALYIFNKLLLAEQLNNFGVRPRTLWGLLGIPITVFLHGDEEHLWGNTIWFLIFGGRLIFLKGISEFVLVTLVAALIGGFGTWLFGRQGSNHIGASGVILGYFGFLLLRGFVEHDLLSALLSMLMVGFFITTLSELLPRERMSWAGHFWGFMGGAIAARYLNVIRENLPPGWFG